MTFVIPVTAVFWGAVLFHERLSIQTLAGMAVILFGIVLTSLRRMRRQPAEEVPEAAAARRA